MTLKFWAAAALALAALVLGSHYLGRRSGAKQAHAEDLAKEQAALVEADARYRKQEKTHDEQVQQLRLAYAAEAAKQEAANDAHARDLRSGAERLRFKVAACRPVAAGAGPTTTRVDDPEEADLAPEVAERIFAIAADGDAAIEQLTALQAWARSAVVLCGGGLR